MPLPTALHLRRAQARAELHAGRVDSARDLLQAVVDQAPDDLEARLWLGDAALAAGDLTSAEANYTAAQRLRQDDHDVAARLKLVQAERGRGQAAWRERSIERDLGGIRQDLGELDESLSFISEIDIRKAALLLDEIVTSREPATLISDRLNEVGRLLPALVELNIRVARRDGQDEVADALGQLLVSLRLQRAESTTPQAVRGGPLRALVVAPVAGSGFTRIPATALRAHGAEVDEHSGLAAERARDYDVIIAHEPHADVQVTQGLALAAAEGATIIVSLACDYARLPIEHPAFHRLGLGSAERVESFVTALGLADLIIAPAEAMAETLRAAGHRTRVLPMGWARTDGAWDLPREPRSALSIGWVAGPGTHLDLAQIRREVARVVRAHPEVRLTLAGDPLAYQHFAQLIPESQRQYLPPVSVHDRPYLLGQFDILLLPLRSGDYAESLGLQPFIEAGARGLPWIATPTLAARDWGSGGVLAEGPEAWVAQLTRLCEETQLRAELSTAGRRAAEAFETGALAEAWWRATTGALPLNRLARLNGPTPTREHDVNMAPIRAGALTWGADWS